MSDLLCLATIALAGLTQASLQLSFGALILLYHASMGRHRRKRTRFLAKSYIWGVGTVSFLMICCLAFLIDTIMGGALSILGLLILVGTLCAIAFVMWGLYFRGTGTELWIPRNLSRYVSRRARNANDNLEAFSLGMLSNFLEMPLSIVLSLVAANAMITMSSQWQVLAALLFAMLSIAPLIYLKLTIKTGHNALEIQKWRQKNKKFLKNIASSSFLTLALFIIAFWVVK